MLVQEPEYLHELCEYFGLGEPGKIWSSGGYANSNFKIETEKGQCFVKYIKEHRVEDLESEIFYLDRISSTGFLCPAYLVNSKGSCVFQKEQVIAVVQPFLEGNTPGVLSSEQLATLGTALAKLHSIDCSSLPERTTWWHAGYLETSLGKAQKRFGRKPLSKLEQKISTLKSIRTSDIPVSIVHGDPWSGNTIFNDKQLLTLVDWEEVTIGFPVFDLAFLALDSCFPGDRFDTSMFDELIKSYEQNRLLTDSERRIFGDAVQTIVCTTSLWHVLKYDGHSADKALQYFDWYLSLDLDKLKLKYENKFFVK